MAEWLDSVIEGELARRAQSGQRRCRRIVTPLDSVHIEIDGARLVNFCSNDYLGLSHHPKLTSAMQRAAEYLGAGSGSAGLISGYTPAHASAERAIASWKKTAAAVLMPSGYQANIAAIQTFAALGARFLLDKLCHASLLDAVRAAEAPWRVFPHNGIAKLRRLLGDAEPGQLQVVVTESIFSMDGDAADLAATAELKKHFKFALLLDEAHAGGVYGDGGAGLAHELGLSDAVDVSVATLSKAAGCMGGAVCGSEAFCTMLINAGRAYVFSTSVPASNAAAVNAAIQLMRDEPERQQRVRELAVSLRQQLKEMGYGVKAGDSPIIPIVVGTEEAAVEASEKLFKAGLLVAAIRPPTVPRGASRLRITVSCEHSDESIERLVAELSGCVTPAVANQSY